jgi:hypothetical protein
MKYMVVRVIALAVLALTLPRRATGQCMRWDSSTGMGPYAGNTFVLASFDDGSGLVLHAGSDSGAVRKWTGASWTPVGNDEFDGVVYALGGYDDGSGVALYAGGSFSHLYWSGAPMMAISKLVSGTWHLVGTGLPAYSAYVSSFAVFDDGGGKKLYVGGGFASYPTVQSDSLLSWDGLTWRGIGGRLAPAPPYWPTVQAMCTYDDGSGPALYVGGLFAGAGGIRTNNIAKWNGSSWSALGSGILGGHFTAVTALAVYDDGSGPALYAAGDFNSAGGVPANGIAKWNGTSWSAVPGVSPGPPANYVYALAVHNDGNGRALYVSGYDIVPPQFNFVGRWDGTTWSSLGAGVSSGPPYSLLSFDDGQGGGPALLVGGAIGQVGGNLQSYSVARWYGGCTHPIDAMCFGDGTFAACPCPNYGASLHGCRNSASTSGALLSHSGTTNPDTLALISSSEPSASLSMFLQSDSLRPTPRSFGDGILCLGGQLRRMYLKSAVGGTAQAPSAGDPSITQRSAALGDPIAPGSVRSYQVWYRDPSLGFCGSIAFNISNGLRVVW